MSRTGPASGPVIVRTVGRQSVQFDGPRFVLEEIRALNLLYQRARHGGGWLVRQRDAADLMAALEARGRTLEVTL